MFAGVGRIRGGIQPVWGRRVRFTRYQPRRSMICVAVPLVVAGHDIQQDMVLHVWVQVLKPGPDDWEHTPKENKTDFINDPFGQTQSRYTRKHEDYKFIFILAW